MKNESGGWGETRLMLEEIDTMWTPLLKPREGFFASLTAEKYTLKNRKGEFFVLHHLAP